MTSNIPCAMCTYDPTLTVAGSWQLHLAVPAVSGNALRGNGRGSSGWQYRSVRNRYYNVVKAGLTVPPATAKRRVTFMRYYAGKSRPFDTDNLITGMKPLRDVLTMLGLLVDDGPHALEAHYLQEPGNANTISILIEDITEWNETTP